MMTDTGLIMLSPEGGTHHSALKSYYRTGHLELQSPVVRQFPVKTKYHEKQILRLFPPGKGVGWFNKRTEVLQFKRGLLITISKVHVFISEKKNP